MKRRVIHVLPVFALTDEPGWLILTRKKNDPIAESFHSISGATWEPPVKSWFVPHDRIADALDAVDVSNSASCLFCADCQEGHACEAWGKIPRLEYVLREAEEVEPPNRSRLEFAESLFFWRDVMSEEAKQAVARERYAKERAEWERRQQAQANARRAQTQDFFASFETFFASFFASPQPNPQLRNAANVLSVPWPCTKDALNAAYRKAAFNAHPDRGGSTENMAKINAARDVLLKALG